MRFIIANDDGVEAVGIKTIANALKRAGHDVTVVAPFANRSGFSHSLSVRKNMGFKNGLSGYAEGVKVYALDGTPADCVKFAVHHFGEDSFDVVLSGINNGANLSYDTMYSGTVGAAMEGGIQGMTSVALSVGLADKATHFQTAAEVFIGVLPQILEHDRSNVVWNVNVPDVSEEEIKGIRFTRLGRINYDETYTAVDMEKEGGYILKGRLKEEQISDLSTDVGAFFKGYVSITPLAVDRTNHAVLEELE